MVASVDLSEAENGDFEVGVMVTTPDTTHRFAARVVYSVTSVTLVLCICSAHPAVAAAQADVKRRLAKHLQQFAQELRIKYTTASSS